MGADGEDGFFARWSRRKGQARGPADPAAPAPGRPDPEPASAAQGLTRPGPAARTAPAGLGAAAPAEATLSSADHAPAGPGPTAPAALHGPTAPPAVPAAEPPPPTLEDAARLRPGEPVDRFVRAGVDEAVKRAALKTLFADPHFNVMDGLDIYIDDYGRPDPIPPAMLRQLKQSEALGLFRAEREAEARAAAEAAHSAAGQPPGRDAGAEGEPGRAPEVAVSDEAADPPAAGPGTAPPAGEVGPTAVPGRDTDVPPPACLPGLPPRWPAVCLPPWQRPAGGWDTRSNPPP